VFIHPYVNPYPPTLSLSQSRSLFQCKGKVNMGDADNVRNSESEENGFEIVFPERTYVIVCESLAERNDMVMRLQINVVCFHITHTTHTYIYLYIHIHIHIYIYIICIYIYHHQLLDPLCFSPIYVIRYMFPSYCLPLYYLPL
jgi:hypothetical protein